ncbi:hypothetical protein I2I11_17230 [Pontibacter sp. 172403-2]|uniref:hypothetical protein n=1 Tax=Pontibacter rufus TaxID=2791028 RepID=UPI0018AF8115|nr:hypothetical protein [Pontibacter sp. 172403-2]MBF9255044.1 hypothetical protein [Pontibacter sp. 172403-2]
MVLFQNSIVKLDYNPATDILEIEYPDLHGYLLLEIKHNIDIIVDIIKSYDVKRLILDSTRTVISVSEEESREIAMYLAMGVMKTRVQKVARLESYNSTLEEAAQNNVRHIEESQLLPFLIKNFTCKADAVAWLTGSM